MTQELSRRTSQEVNKQQVFNRMTCRSSLGGHQVIEDVLMTEVTAERLQKVAPIMAFEFAPQNTQT